MTFEAAQEEFDKAMESPVSDHDKWIPSHEWFYQYGISEGVKEQRENDAQIAEQADEFILDPDKLPAIIAKAIRESK